MPRRAQISILMPSLIGAGGFVIGALVAMTFLMIGAYLPSLFATDSSVQTLITAESILWPTSGWHNLLIGPVREPEVYYERITWAIAENGVLYAIVTLSIWCVFINRKRVLKVRSERPQDA